MIKNITLGIIIFVAFFLRTYSISTIPPGLSWDEVSIGYNAYSILKTGKDEHGKFLPVDYFAAYGDYKPPVAVYVTVPFVALLGLNELSVRLPSALFGTLTVALTFFLVLELFSTQHSANFEYNKKFKPNNPIRSYLLPFLTSALLAISPWHINISRVGFEANIALFFVLLGIYIVLRTKNHPSLWTVAWMPFVIAIYTFNSSRYFVVIFSLFIVIYCFSEIKNNLRMFFVGLLTAFIAVIPILPHLISKEARIRYQEVNIFSDPTIVIKANERIEQSGNNVISKIIFNRRIGYARSYIKHFLDNFEPSFLFIKGDGNPKFSTQDIGQLYLIEAPFLIFGLLTMVQVSPRIALFLIAWLLCSIIPAATARETPHALRILNSLPTWQIFIAFGISEFMKRLRERTVTKNFLLKKSLINYFISKGIITILLIIYIMQFGYYVYNYHTHYPRIYASEWQYGYKQAFEYIKNIQNSYDHIYVTDRIGRPYMYSLFYTAYDPDTYINTKKSYFDASGFYHVEGYGKYQFVPSLPVHLPSESLVVGDLFWSQSNNKILTKIKYPNGGDALIIFE